MDANMLRRGAELVKRNQISLKPFNGELFIVWSKYDLDCLVAELKYHTNDNYSAEMDWSVVNTTELNWELLTISTPHVAGYNIIYAPIITRYGSWTSVLSLLTRLQVYISKVCLDIVGRAGYDPNTGSVMFNHLIATAYFDMTAIIGDNVGGTLTYVPYVQRDLFKDITAEQWKYITPLSTISLYSAARTLSNEIDHGHVCVDDERDGWHATSYF